MGRAGAAYTEAEAAAACSRELTSKPCVRAGRGQPGNVNPTREKEFEYIHRYYGANPSLI